MPRWILLTDTQLESSPPRDKIGPGGASVRFKENVETIRRCLNEGMQAGCAGWIFPGDLTEHKNPNSLEMNAAASLFRTVLDQGGTVHAIPGNHDGAEFKVSSSSLAPLARMAGDRFKLHHKVTFDPVLGCLFVPYIHRASREKIRELVIAAYKANQPIPGKKNFAVIHYGGEGSVVGARNTVLETDYLSPYDLATDLYPLDHVFQGHIHKYQEFFIGDVGFHGPGSPVINDMGERDDRKCWFTWDDETREIIVHDIKQEHRWISEPYDPALATATWTERDIVTLTGSYTRPDYPKDTIATAIKSGTLPQPFDLDTKAVKPERPKRISRGPETTVEGGLKEKALDFVRREFNRASDKPGVVGPATQLVLDAIKESGGGAFCPQIVPDRMTLVNFGKIATLDHTFGQGTPLLILADNGKGKTWFLDAPLWILTGKTSKGLSMSGVVRRRQTKCEGTLFLIGYTPENEDRLFRITRSVSLSKSGTATQDLSVAEFKKLTGEWDTETLNDGGIRERQARIDLLVGGSYRVLRTVNFKFQGDTEPFISTDPTERKAIIGEVSGDEQLLKAFKMLDAQRLEHNKAFQTARDQLSGMVTGGEGNDERLKTLGEEKVTATGVYAEASVKLLPAEKAVTDTVVQVEKTRAQEKELVDKIAALPNTEAALASATQARDTYETTYSTERAKKLETYKQLTAHVAEASAELKTKEPPEDAPTVASLEATYALHKGAFDFQTEKRNIANGVLTKAKAEVNAADGVVSGLGQELEQAQANPILSTTLESEGAATKTLQDSDAAASAMDSLFALRSEELLNAGSATREAKRKVTDLEVERKSFDGKDVGKCSKCGQSIDSSHIEMELKRIDETLVIARAAVVEAEKTELKASEVLAEAAENKRSSVAKAREASENLSELRRKMDSQTNALARAQEMHKKLTAAKENAANWARIHDTAYETAGKANDAYDDAYALAANANDKLEAAKTADASLAALRSRIAEMQRQLTELTATGKQEAAEHITKSQELGLAVQNAMLKHEEIKALSTALALQMADAHALVVTATEARQAAAVALEKAKGDISSAKSNLDSLIVQIAHLEGEQRKIADARFKLASLQEQAEIHAMAAQILDPKQGFPVELIDSRLPELEDRANQYMEALGAGNFIIELSTQAGDKETLDILIDDGEDGPKLDIRGYSGGERDCMEIALKEALGDLRRNNRGVNFGFKGFDEPTGGLQRERKKNLVKLLHDRCKIYPVTVVTTHDPEFRDSFDNRMEMV